MSTRRQYTAHAIAIAGFLALVAPADALAHGALKKSSPAAGARLSTAPRQLRLDFSQPPELTFTSVALVGPDGAAVFLDSLRIAPDSKNAVIAAIRGVLSEGRYAVVWKIGGADGHPVRGRFSFVIEAGATGLGGAAPTVPAGGGEPSGSVTAPGQATPPAEHHDAATESRGEGFDAESPLYVAIRWLQFTLLLVVIGAIAFRFAVLRGVRLEEGAAARLLPELRDRVASAGLAASVGLAIIALLRLYAQSYAIHGAEGAGNATLVAQMLRRTVWGWGWMLQAAAVATSAWGFARARQRDGRGWIMAAAAVTALAFTPALSGHAAATPNLAALAILADGVHVASAGGWLGSLLMLVGIGIPVAMRFGADQRGSAVAELVNAFSPTALLFAGTVATTGVLAAWLHLGSVPALWQTAYGLALLRKLVVLLVVVGTGAYNWLRVKPGLGASDGVGRVRRSAGVELAVGLLVLLLTAVLVATPTPIDESLPTAVGRTAS